MTIYECVVEIDVVWMAAGRHGGLLACAIGGSTPLKHGEEDGMSLVGWWCHGRMK